MKNKISIGKVLECINDHQINIGDITFDEGQLEYNESELDQSDDDEINEIVIIAKSRGQSSEEEMREFSLEIENGKVKVI